MGHGISPGPRQDPSHICNEHIDHPTRIAIIPACRDTSTIGSSRVRAVQVRPGRPDRWDRPGACGQLRTRGWTGPSRAASEWTPASGLVKK